MPDASSFLATSKEFGKILSVSIYSFILTLTFGNLELGPSKNDYLLISSSQTMMIIVAIISLSDAILLAYSKYHYKLNVNKEILNKINKIKPRWIKFKD